MVLVFLGVLRIVQDYVVYPRLIGHGIHLHPLAIILAILCGEKLAGVAGVFLAIPVVAVVTVSYRHWMEHRGSEGLADLLEPESVAAAGEVVGLGVVMPGTPGGDPPPAGGSDSTIAIHHPTSHTTPDEMTRERPDLTTGELKLPGDD